MSLLSVATIVAFVSSAGAMTQQRPDQIVMRMHLRKHIEENGKFWEQAQQAWQSDSNQTVRVASLLEVSDKEQKKKIWDNFKKGMHEDVEKVFSSLEPNMTSGKQSYLQKQSNSSDVSEVPTLQELKGQIWASFKGFLEEAIDKVDEIKHDEDLKPLGLKHGARLSAMMKKYNDTHPGADMSPSALLALSSEQQNQVKTQVGASGPRSVCSLARPVVMMISGLYCSMLFGWTFFSPSMGLDWGACGLAFMLPFDAVCLPQYAGDSIFSFLPPPFNRFGLRSAV